MVTAGYKVRVIINTLMPPEYQTPFIPLVKKYPGVASSPDPSSLKEILLPNKDFPSLDSSSRVEAGKVLEDQRTPLVSSMPQSKSAAELLHKETIDTPNVPRLETYERDVSNVIRGQNISAVTIAAAETQRRMRTREAPVEQAQSIGAIFNTIFYIASGILLLFGTVVAMYYVIVSQNDTTVLVRTDSQIINTDSVTDLHLPPESTQKEVITLLQKAIITASGHVEELRLTHVVEKGETSLTSSEFSRVALPGMPALLSNSLSDNFTFGVIVTENHDPFLALQVNSYEQAFAGMLSWESTILSDLSLYFPTPKPTTLQRVGTSSALDSDEPDYTPMFIDEIIENRDTRVARNQNGEIILFWSFLDRSTLILAKTQNTLQETVARLTKQTVVTP